MIWREIIILENNFCSNENMVYSHFTIYQNKKIFFSIILAKKFQNLYEI